MSRHTREVASAGGGAVPPAAAVAVAPLPKEQAAELAAEAARTPAPFDLNKPSQSELSEPTPKRRHDWINEAVGSDFLILDGAACGWTCRDGYAFAVTRLYPHLKVAVDFPRKPRDVEHMAEKAAILKAQGIAYIGIGPGEALNVVQLRERVESARRAIAAAAAPAAKAGADV